MFNLIDTNLTATSLVSDNTLVHEALFAMNEEGDDCLEMVQDYIIKSLGLEDTQSIRDQISYELVEVAGESFEYDTAEERDEHLRDLDYERQSEDDWYATQRDQNRWIVYG